MFSGGIINAESAEFGAENALEKAIIGVANLNSWYGIEVTDSTESWYMRENMSNIFSLSSGCVFFYIKLDFI